MSALQLNHGQMSSSCHVRNNFLGAQAVFPTPARTSVSGVGVQTRQKNPWSSINPIFKCSKGSWGMPSEYRNPLRICRYWMGVSS